MTLRLKRLPSIRKASALEASHASEPVDLGIYRRDTVSEWEGGEIVLLAYAVAGDRHGDGWWHGMNWADWAAAHEKNMRDAEQLGPDRGWVPLPTPPQLSAEERAARDRANDEENVAFMQQLYGPLWYVERNNDLSNPTVGSEWLSAKAKDEAKRTRSGKSKPALTVAASGKPRKPRKKPVFYTPKKAD